MQVAEYCTCGALFRGYCPSRDNPRVQQVITHFWEGHQGEGHGSTDKRIAANARRREYARLDREDMAERKRLKGR